MSIFDISVLILILYSIYRGIKNGFIMQASSILGLILGVYLSYRLSSFIVGYLNEWFNASETVTKIASFVLIILAAMLCANIMGKIVSKFFDIIMLGWVNKLLGAVIGVAFTLLIVGTLVYAAKFIDKEWVSFIPETFSTDSIFFEPLYELANIVFPYFKDFFKLNT